MMRNMWKLFKECELVAIVSLMAVNVYAANQTDDAQQALQQLRLLQQRLSQNQAPEGQAANNANTTGGAATGNAASPGPTQPAQTTNKANPGQGQGSAGNGEQVMSQDDVEVIDNKAFKDMTRSLYPLTPEQVVRLKQIYQTNEYAQASTPGTPPKP